MSAEKPKRIFNMDAVECLPEAEDRFNTWYNEVHIPHLLESGEIKKATRLRRVSGDENAPKYLVIYELEDMAAFARYEQSPQLVEAKEKIKHIWPKDGPVQRQWRVQYEVIADWET